MNICIHTRLCSFALVLPKTLNCTSETASYFILDMILMDTLEGSSVALGVCILILKVFLVPSWRVGSQNIRLIHLMISPALFVPMLQVICHDCILAGVTGSLTIQ